MPLPSQQNTSKKFLPYKRYKGPDSNPKEIRDRTSRRKIKVLKYYRPRAQPKKKYNQTNKSEQENKIKFQK